MDGARVKRFGPRLGLVVATSLVTVALMGGGPVGAFSVPNNSVTSAKIVNNSIQGVDIKDGTVASVDIRNGTVASVDIANGSITGADVDPSSVGQPRMSAYVNGGATAGASLQTSGLTGVASVTNPSTGRFCITPSDPGVDPATSIPNITLEFDGTAAFDTLVGSVRGNAGCPGAFEVVGWHPSTEVNNVAFTITVA